MCKSNHMLLCSTVAQHMGSTGLSSVMPVLQKPSISLDNVPHQSLSEANAL